jgi:hypothetical protein
MLLRPGSVVVQDLQECNLDLSTLSIQLSPVLKEIVNQKAGEMEHKKNMVLFKPVM